MYTRCKMDSDDLINLLACLCKPKNVNYAVIASDEFDTISLDSLPLFVIFNESPRSSIGSHWCAAMFIKKRSEIVSHVFDSYGVPINKKEFQYDFRVGTENLQQLQSNYSTVCGYWCLYWIYCKLNKVDEKTFLSLFSGDVNKNDNIVKNFGIRLRRCCKYDFYKCSKKIGCVARLGNSAIKNSE